jgi:hypothetical protein
VTEELPAAELVAALASALLGLDDGASLEVVVRLPDGRTAPLTGVLYDPATGVLELSAPFGDAYRSPTGRLRDSAYYLQEDRRRNHDDWLERQLRAYRPGPGPVSFPFDRDVMGDLYGFPTAATPVTDPLRSVQPEPEPAPPATEPELPS